MTHVALGMEVCVGHLGLVWHWGSRALKESHPLTQKYTFTKRLYSIQEGPPLLCVLESSGNHLKAQNPGPTLRVFYSVVLGWGQIVRTYDTFHLFFAAIWRITL